MGAAQDASLTPCAWIWLQLVGWICNSGSCYLSCGAILQVHKFGSRGHHLMPPSQNVQTLGEFCGLEDTALQAGSGLWVRGRATQEATALSIDKFEPCVWICQYVDWI